MIKPKECCHQAYLHKVHKQEGRDDWTFEGYYFAFSHCPYCGIKFEEEKHEYVLLYSNKLKVVENWLDNNGKGYVKVVGGSGGYFNIPISEVKERIYE